jgi:hypothetical protein
MYCPVCGAEYRPGFTECSDCQVALVAEPPHVSSEEESAEYASYVTIWSGDDPLKHAEILDALDAAEIPARSLNREDRSFHLVTMPAFEVFVPADLADSAQQALKQIAAIEDPERPGSGIFEIPADEDVPDQGDYDDGEGDAGLRSLRRQTSRPMNPYDEHEDANVEVWSGQGATTANMIALSLRENEILFRRDPDPSGAGTAEPTDRRESQDRDSRIAAREVPATTIFVYPQDEHRAREIIREILSASPTE